MLLKSGYKDKKIENMYKKIIKICTNHTILDVCKACRGQYEPCDNSFLMASANGISPCK